MSGPAGADDRLVARADPALLARVRDLAARRMVFLAGLPGTGKSLLVHQIGHLARAGGRAIHLLQWDVARPALRYRMISPARPCNTRVVRCTALGRG